MAVYTDGADAAARQLIERGSAGGAEADDDDLGTVRVAQRQLAAQAIAKTTTANSPIIISTHRVRFCRGPSPRDVMSNVVAAGFLAHRAGMARATVRRMKGLLGALVATRLRIAVVAAAAALLVGVVWLTVALASPRHCNVGWTGYVPQQTSGSPTSCQYPGPGR